MVGGQVVYGSVGQGREVVRMSRCRKREEILYVQCS